MAKLTITTLDNDTVSIKENVLDKFISGLRGEVLLGDHPEYEEVRKI